MYRLGTVSQVDAATCRAKVQLEELETETYWLEVLQRNTLTNRDYHMPDVGELVAVLLDNRDEAGCILGAIYTGENKPTDPSADIRRVVFGDDTLVEYNRAESKLTISASGDLAVTVAGDCTVEVTGDATVNAENLNVTATVSVTGDTTIKGATVADGTLKVAGGGQKVALAQKTADALTTLKNAIASAVPTPQDGGAGLKSTLLAGLAAWPPDVGAAKLTSD